VPSLYHAVVRCQSVKNLQFLEDAPITAGRANPGADGGPAAHLCLPLIRPIGSRRPPEVFVMEPTDAWHLHDNALARPLYTPRLR